MVHNLDLCHVLALQQNTTANKKSAFASNQITFNQVADQSFKQENVGQKLVILQDVHSNLIRIAASNKFLPNQKISYVHTIKPNPIVHALNLIPSLNSVLWSKNHPISSIAFNQSVQATKGKFASSKLALEQNLIFNLSHLPHLQNAIVFQNQVAYYNISGKPQPEPPLDIDRTGSIYLTYGTWTLRLRNPEFGDSDKYTKTRVVRKTRGGSAIVYRDPSWNTKEILSYSFRALKQEDATTLLSFLKASLGKNVELKDHIGKYWIGVITTPGAQVAQYGRGCQFSASFEFEGTIMESGPILETFAAKTFTSLMRK